MGLFWDDADEKMRRYVAQRRTPPIPETGWQPLKEFPNLSGARVLGFDTETYDPELLKYGPGWARGVGHVIGVSLATEDNRAWYIPLRHQLESEHNLPLDHARAWLCDTLGTPRVHKVGANLLYDVGWLAQEGVAVRGKLFDVQFAEALLNERGLTNVDHLGLKYLGFGKETTLLYDWIKLAYGVEKEGDIKGNFYRTPPRLVGPYAERDAVVPLRVAEQQYPLLVREGLLDVFHMENALIPLLVAMRFAGVSVDLDRATQLRGTLLAEEQKLQNELDAMAGVAVDINSGASIARAFDALGIKYLRTAPTVRNPNGNPSFTKEWLNNSDEEISKKIVEVRTVNKLRSTFVESYVLRANVRGKVHGQFHPLRGDAGGTRSGRLASSTPNLQNVPARDPVLAPLVRGLFIPDYGHRQWRRFDYSQIEYRFLVHFAVGPGADEARALYNSNPLIDYHEFVLEMVAPLAGWDISTPDLRKRWRKPLKNINFGLIYGMGIPKLLRSLGLSKEDGDLLFSSYHEAIPYARATMEHTAEQINADGYVATIMGRRSRFDLWESVHNDPTGAREAYPFDEAIRLFGQVRRAKIHKGINRKLQGSAADMIKKAMLQCWEDGIFSVTGVPRVSVHDELGFSDPGGALADEAFKAMKHTMETCIPLRVPVVADEEVGPDWGAAK